MSEYRRNKECPNCHVDWWKKEYAWVNEEWSKVWECPNCLHKDPRRENKRGTEITPSQIAAMARVKARMLRPGYEGDKVEVKSEDHHMIENTGLVSYAIDVGKVNDNNGLYFLRRHLHVVIGRGGKVFTYDNKGKKVEGDEVYTCKL